jgi:DNA modification methylase
MIHEGDAGAVLGLYTDEFFDCVVTSPPYFGHRSYGGSELGMEPTVEGYVTNLVGIFREVRRVLKSTVTCFLNVGETYLRKRAQLAPQRVAVGLADDGWVVRNEIVWVRVNVRPESAKDRLTNAVETILFCTREPSGYFFDPEPLREPAAWDYWGKQTSAKAREQATGSSWQSVDPDRRAALARTRLRHPRNVWAFGIENTPGNGLARFPEELPRRCLQLGCPPRGVVLDPFAGSGTTLVVARALGLEAVGIDTDPAAVREMRRRLAW